jgi:hypothetical protein
MGEYDYLLKWDLEPVEPKDWKSDALKYAVEIRDDLEHREGKNREIPLAGERSSRLYSKKFPRSDILSIFKKDVLKNILEGEDNEDREKLIRVFVDDEIEEYQKILEQKDKLFRERGEIKEKDPKGYQTYLELSKYYEVVVERIKRIKAEIEVSKGEERKNLEQHLKDSERAAKGFGDERFDTLYGKKMREIYDLMDDVRKKTGGRGLKLIEDRFSRLREIQSHI